MIKISTKKGQLFIIEAFIAVTVMIIMVTAIYEVQLNTHPPQETKIDQQLYDVFNNLERTGKLDQFIVALKTGNPTVINENKLVIENAFKVVLPANGEIKFYCYNVTSSQIIENSWINKNVKPSGAVTSSEYLILEVNGNYEPFIFHLEAWLKGV